MTEHGPDNPRPWDPNHALLRSGAAPHETSGLMRIHRAGHSGKFILTTFKMKAMALSRAFSKAMEEEERAYKSGRDIHDVVLSRKRT
ncbi:hypothetical protein SEA_CHARGERPOWER_67 [Mycobacterium phage Chargerpower]|nr:hypothetical protein SEA_CHARGERPOWER_67 [Mycobacterium phage Chargerpower]